MFGNSMDIGLSCFGILRRCTIDLVALHSFVTTDVHIHEFALDDNTNGKKEYGNRYNNYGRNEDLNHIKSLYLQVQK